MSHAIIRGKSGRRHEVDFGDSPVRVEIYASDKTVEIVVEADSDELPQERRHSTKPVQPSHGRDRQATQAAVANPRPTADVLSVGFREDSTMTPSSCILRTSCCTM